MPMPTDHVTRVSLSDEAYSRIEAAILDGTLAPGERLRDPDLVAWLGISRTPIRHALERLMAQGLVEMERNRFTRVAPFDVVGVKGAVEVAADLWSGAVRRSLASWEPEDIAIVAEIANDLVRSTTDQDVSQVVGGLEHLVTTCVLVDGNPVRLRTLTNVLPQVHRLARKLVGRPVFDDMCTFVDEFTVALGRQDGRAAADLIDRHVQKLMRSIPDPT
ncbi:GntR family transcriptional regulator [Leifsonia sp. NPDC058292]|uniref:GntR family transcriptional regulator n=1 Tax=Leifsonia sp. NPDC058292 TaxID=3346428 RepID=UPI0036DAD8D6